MNRRLKAAFRVIPILVVGTAIVVATARPVQATVPGNNTLVSVKNDGTQGGSASLYPAMSKDGRFVAFDTGSNLIAGDTNNTGDIYVRDMVSNTTERVSVSSSGVQSNSNSRAPHISANGRYVVFQSVAKNLIDGLTLPASPNHWHVYVHDRQTDTTEMADMSTGGAYGDGQADDLGSYDISEDGRFVVFESAATNLVNVGGVGSDRIYVKDRVLNTLTLISRTTAGQPAGGRAPTMSCDGAFIAFNSTANNITSGDTNGVQDVFLVERVGGDYTTNITQTGTGASTTSKISCNGNFLTLTTTAALDSSDTDSQNDTYVYDRINDSFERVNIDSSENAANTPSDTISPSSVTDDGRLVVFLSAATNLDVLATSGMRQVYLRDRLNGTTELVSKNSTPTAGNDDSGSTNTNGKGLVISPDGSKVVYSSKASNLVASDVNGTQHDVFIAPTGY